MALSRLTAWVANQILTRNALVAEFDNIYNNALSLISPLTGNLNANLKQITNLLLETQASSQSAATEGRVYYQTSEDQIHVDDGSAIRRVPTVASVTRGDMIRATANNQWARLALPASGRFIQSDGTDIAGSAYTLPTSVSASGTLLRSDGTNYVGSTATYPNTAAAGTALYADASNTVSASVMGGGVTVLTTGDVTTTSGSLANITGLSVTITKAYANTKLLVGMTLQADSGGAAGVGMAFSILRGATELFGTGGMAITNPGTNYAVPVGLTTLISGLAAGSYTFQGRFRSDGAATVTVQADATNSATIWAQEVA